MKQLLTLRAFCVNYCKNVVRFLIACNYFVLFDSVMPLFTNYYYAVKIVRCNYTATVFNSFNEVQVSPMRY